jgi:hypothetical protein
MAMSQAEVSSKVQQLSVFPACIRYDAHLLDGSGGIGGQSGVMELNRDCGLYRAWRRAAGGEADSSKMRLYEYEYEHVRTFAWGVGLTSM